MGRFRHSAVHPYLFHLGRIVLPTYGFLLAIGTILALLVCVRNARVLGLDTDRIWTMALLAVATLLLTSKLLLAIFLWRQYGPAALGMSVYGTQEFGISFASILAACAAVVAYALHRGVPLLRAADAAAPSIALSQSIQYIACLEAGCDYGAPAHLPWAIIFRSRSAVPGTPLGVPLHPTQLYESLTAFVIFGLLLRLLHAPHHDGEILGAYLFLGGLANGALAPLRGDPGLWIAGWIPAAQLLSAAMVIAAGYLWMRHPKPTQVTSRG